MTEPASPQVLVVTSAGASPDVSVPVLAALEAIGARVRAIDVGGAGASGTGVADRVRRALLGETAERRLRKELEANPPDAAVAFDPHAALALTVARDQVANPAPVVAVIADLDPVSEWRQTDADRFLSVDEPAAVALAELGVEAERILVVGPIGERAYADAGIEDRGALRLRFQLVGSPVVVDVAGLGAEAVGSLVLQLSLAEGADRMHFLFDAAGDPEVASVLRRQVPALGLRGKLFGATADAALLWRAADAIIGRPRSVVVSRALLVGGRLVAIVDDNIAGAARVVAALEVRGRAVPARNPMLVAGALELALKAPAPAPMVDGADTVADVVWAVAGDKRGVIDERRAAARAATSERVRTVSAAADAAAKVTAMPGELEDLGGGDPVAAAGAVPAAGEIERLQREVRLRIAEMTRSMMSARDAAERWRAEGDARKADAETAHMHSFLRELATLEAELKDLDRAAAAPRPRPGPGPRSTAALDDELANLKRTAATGPAPPSKPSAGTTGSARPAGRSAAVDAELAALKHKMAQKKKP